MKMVQMWNTVWASVAHKQSTEHGLIRMMKMSDGVECDVDLTSWILNLNIN